jgi:hypothetical protein
VQRGASHCDTFVERQDSPSEALQNIGPYPSIEQSSLLLIAPAKKQRPFVQFEQRDGGQEEI